METQLPELVRLKLAKTLARYPEWRDIDPGSPVPVPVRMLGDSANNCSILVANDRRYVVRVNRRTPAFNALDPGAEVTALSLAAAAGLAPAFRFCSAEQGTMVCDYLPPSPSQSASLLELAELLRRIHALPAIPHRLELTQRIDHYATMARTRASTVAERRRVVAASGKARDCGMRLEAADDRRVLCHNDLLPANRLRSGGKLWAIDWEYAAMGSPWFDLAGACAGEAFGHEDQRSLLTLYLGRAPQETDLEMLGWGMELYRHLEWIWQVCHDAS